MIYTDIQLKEKISQMMESFESEVEDKIYFINSQKIKC